VLRLGNASFSATQLPFGTALPLFVDYYDVSSGVSSSPFRSVPLALSRAAAGDASPRSCTLARGTPALDAEGLPSNSFDRLLALVPCYDVAPGVRGVIAAGTGGKSLAVVANARTLAAIHNVPIGGGLSTRANGTTSGFRQVASVDGRAFYTASIAASDYGIRYFVPGASTSVRISGMEGKVPPAGAPQGGTNDIRSLVLGRFPARLHAVSSPLDAGWDTIYQLCTTRACDSAASLPVSAATDVQLLPALGSAWTFVFDNVWTVWVSSVTAAGGAELRQYVNRVFLSGDQARTRHWVREYTKSLVTAGPLRSLTGRTETVVNGVGALATAFVMYACDGSNVFRVDSLSKAHTVVAAAPAHTQFRGVVLPPPDAPSPTPTKTPTKTLTRTPTRSKSPKARK